VRKKVGQLSGASKKGNPIIKTPAGVAYEVSFVTSYVWEQLDGKHSEDSVCQELAMLAEVDVLEISPKVSLIIKELERRGLVITTPNPVQKL
jgi:hypothetical protein